jgi:DNA-binding NarL/FixJ family response regulator
LRDILVVDDHPVIETACRLLLEGVGNVIAAQDADNAYQAVLQHKPEVIIIDLSLRESDTAGLALIARIRLHDPNAKILVFSMHASVDALVASIEAGATGYLAKDAPTEELAKAVQKVHLGLRYIDAQLAVKLAFPAAPLTARERQVLNLLMDGTSYAAIADQLGVSRTTVAEIGAQVRRKLGERGSLILIRSERN